jgi:hypothetical protein
VLDTNPAARRSITIASIPLLRLERSLVGRRAHDPLRQTGLGTHADPLWVRCAPSGVLRHAALICVICAVSPAAEGREQQHRPVSQTELWLLRDCLVSGRRPRAARRTPGECLLVA